MSDTPIYTRQMVFCNDVSFDDMQSDNELREKIEAAVQQHLTNIDHHGKRIELSYLSAMSAASTGGDKWQKS